METVEIRKELLRRENQYWQAMKDKDVDAAIKLTDFPCIIAGSSGVASIDEEKFTSIMKAGESVVKNFSIKEDAEVRLLSEDIAVIAYELHEDIETDGKSISQDASDSSIWIKRNGAWLCAAHTEAIKTKH